MLTFKPFQLDDVARLALGDGAILAHEQGMGKSLEMLAWALIKQARRVLIVAPGELHEQHKETALKFFGVHLSTLEKVEQLHGYRLHRPPVAGLPTRFWITTYHDLGLNHADEGRRDPGTGREAEGRQRKARLVELEQISREYVKARLKGEKAELAKKWFTGIGAERDYGSHVIRCVWKPTLARVVAQLDCFDCVLVDEGTYLQGMETHLANGVCLLDPRYRLVLTGTPIKNRIESAFRLMLWASGGKAQPSARFPYAGTTAAREQFANDFLEKDKFLDREAALEVEHKVRTGKAKKFTVEKRSARLCNVHRWWKLAGPIILRRRKDECGEDIVPKIVKPIIIPPGTAQQAVYRYHLENPPLAAKATPTIPVHRRQQLGMQLTTLRLAALCPHAQSLAEAVTQVPSAHKRSWTDHNPKSAMCLSLIADQLDAGEQVLVGSPFNEFNESLHRRLVEAGVSSVLLNGSVSPEVRGRLAACFKRKEFSVIVAGLKAMGMGHSFECCSRLILPSFSYAMDENEQFIHRIWRLNSPKPVEIYILGMAGTIDEVVMRGFDEKLDSAQLALDGRLLEERVEEVDTAALLAAAVRHFDPYAETIDERQIEAQWGHLKHRLGLSEARFREHWPRVAGGARAWVTSGEVNAAMKALNLPSPTPLAIALQRRGKITGGGL